MSRKSTTRRGQRCTESLAIGGAHYGMRAFTLFGTLCVYCGILSTATGDCLVEPNETGHLDTPLNETFIRDSACEGCWAVESLTVADTVTHIGAHAFRECVRLVTVSIGAAVTTIGKYAFGFCPSLTSVSFQDGLLTLDAYAFYGCGMLQAAILPDTVENIGNDVFNGCKQLVEVRLGNSMKKVEHCAYCHSGIVNMTVPDSVTSIAVSAFSSCFKLTFLSLSEAATNIPNDVFRHMGALTTVVLGNPVTYIGAIFGGTNLSTINIPCGTFVHPLVSEGIRGCARELSAGTSWCDCQNCTDSLAPCVVSGTPSHAPSTNSPTEDSSDTPTPTTNPEPLHIALDVPSATPSSVPSDAPTNLPFEDPRPRSSNTPSESHASAPSHRISNSPSVAPTNMPSNTPSSAPSDDTKAIQQSKDDNSRTGATAIVSGVVSAVAAVLMLLLVFWKSEQGKKFKEKILNFMSHFPSGGQTVVDSGSFDLHGGGRSRSTSNIGEPRGSVMSQYQQGSDDVDTPTTASLFERSMDTGRDTCEDGEPSNVTILGDEASFVGTHCENDACVGPHSMENSRPIYVSHDHQA